LTSWGEDPLESNQLQLLRFEAQRRGFAVQAMFDKYVKNGVEVYKLGLDLEHRLNRDGYSSSTKQWLDGLALAPDSFKHKRLETILEKWKQWQKNIKLKNQERKQYVPKLNALQLQPHQAHPNKISQLKPASAWTLLIDETGSEFGPEADALNASDRNLGRCVAVVIPSSTKLPPVPGFHGTEVPAAQLEELLQRLLQAPVGVFGFSVKDPAASASNWMAHIHTLLRWVLAQLPLTGDPTHVSARIEIRDNYTAHSGELRALTDILLSELRALAPQRYGALTLDLQFVNKTDPLIGYADAVAYAWGGSSGVVPELLKKTQWLGHCLLRPSDVAPERIYLALYDSEHGLSPSQWYQLCAAAQAEVPGSLLHQALEKLGQSVQRQAEVWRSYLDEARQRLASKNFKLPELGCALEHLQRWAPSNNQIPPLMQLQLSSAQLSASNHAGHCAPELVRELEQRIDALHDEAAPEACATLLRLAVSTSNAFDFNALRQPVERWLGYPIAVPGLLNHAKLHSTLGQMAAFSGQSVVALPHFDCALQALERLSDPQQRQRELQQTRSYRLLAELDHPSFAANDWLARLQTHLRSRPKDTDWASLSHGLALSGASRRYAQHLLLRALLRCPEPLRAARAAYLEAAEQWQTGTEHPWPLINAYRAWLLQQNGHTQPARAWLQEALDGCLDPDRGPTLHWIGLVLHTLGQSLGLEPLEPSRSECSQRVQQLRAQLPTQLPAAPHAALAAFATAASAAHPKQPLPADEIEVHLRQCLPFNFR